MLRDIVKALHSLYTDAKILHRDVSPRNIIIVHDNRGEADAPTGLLIDLDFALDLSNPPADKMLVGSQGFMAVGILGGDDHTYRHDLESLFYVFLQMAICHNGVSSNQIPAGSRLHNWRGKDFLACFVTKRKDMQPAEFSELVEMEFTETFKPYRPLANALHQLLFPDGNGKLFIGTEFGHDAVEHLYGGMVAELERYSQLKAA